MISALLTRLFQGLSPKPSKSASCQTRPSHGPGRTHPTLQPFHTKTSHQRNTAAVWPPFFSAHHAQPLGWQRGQPSVVPRFLQWKWSDSWISGHRRTPAANRENIPTRAHAISSWVPHHENNSVRRKYADQAAAPGALQGLASRVLPASHCQMRTVSKVVLREIPTQQKPAAAAFRNMQEYAYAIYQASTTRWIQQGKTGLN